MTKLYDAQVSVFKRLENDSELMSAVTGVYDFVPEETNFPYVILGRCTATPVNTKTTIGERIEVTLDVWSVYKGKKETANIINLLEASLTDELTVEDADLITQEIKSIEIVEESNELYHGTVVFEILLDLED